MDSLHSRKKAKISLSKVKFSSAEDIDAKKGTSKKEAMIDDWFKKEGKKYYEDVEIPVQNVGSEISGKKTNGWLSKFFFSGIDLNDNEEEKNPSENMEEEITFIETVSNNEYGSKENLKSIGIKNIEDVLETEDEIDRIESSEIENNSVVIKIKNESETDDVRVDVEEDIFPKYSSEIFSKSEELDREYQEGEKNLVFSAEQEAELVFLIREAQNFWQEINGFDWEKSGYLEKGKNKAIELAMEAHIRKLINDYSVELKNLGEEAKEYVIEDIFNVIKKDNA